MADASNTITSMPEVFLTGLGQQVESVALRSRRPAESLTRLDEDRSELLRPVAQLHCQRRGVVRQLRAAGAWP